MTNNKFKSKKNRIKYKEVGKLLNFVLKFYPNFKKEGPRVPSKTKLEIITEWVQGQPNG